MEKNFKNLIFEVAEKYKDKTAFEIRRKIVREQVKYKDLVSYSEKIESFFEKNNIKEGDKVLIWGLNCPEYALILLASFASGRIIVPIDFRNSEEFIIKVTEQTKPKAAFVSKYIRHDFLEEKIVSIHLIEDLFKLIKDAELLKSSGDTENKISEIVYTSGTTGLPKGVVLKEESLLTNLDALSKTIPTLKRYETVSILPLSHAFEQVAGFLLMLKKGGKIIYLPKVNSFRILSALKENSVTHLLVVPQLLNIFYDKIKQKAVESGKAEQLEKALTISSKLPVFVRKLIFKEVHKVFGKEFKFFGCGSAPLNLKIAKNWINMGFTILEGYGATEVSAVATLNTPKDFKLGSVGKVLPGVEIKINESGEIIICSQGVASGYFENEEKTKQVFFDQCYKSGDIGFVDKDGYVYIKGRDAFKIVLPSGEKVYAEDVEKIINKHPLVKDSCAIETNTEKGTYILVYVILDKSKDQNIDLNKVFTEINSELESKQQIRNYEEWIHEDFPRTSTLKIDRKQIIEAVKNKETDKLEKEEKVTHIVNIYDILSNISGFAKSKISDQDNLSSDLAMDSLSRVELISQVEEYLGVSLDEAKIISKTTVSDLVTMIKEAPKDNVDVELPNWQFTKLGRIINFLATRLVFYPFHAYIIKINLKGKENLKEKEGGFIVAFNHPGMLDGICIYRTLAKLGFNNAFVLSSKDFWERKEFKLIRLSLETLGGGLPLYATGSKFIKVLQKSADLLAENYCMLFAPQGGWTKQDKHIHFEAGIGYIMKELNKEVVPIKIKGYEKVWPAPERDLAQARISELLPKKRGSVEVIIGKPMKFRENMNPIEIANLLEEKFNELN